jgi:hypothetical protein
VSGNERPRTIAKMLLETAEWLDLADTAFAVLARMQSTTYPGGSEMQNDLRLLAKWLREHPDTDAVMYASLPFREVVEDAPATGDIGGA